MAIVNVWPSGYRFGKFSQFNGIVCHGEALTAVIWKAHGGETKDAIMVLMRYWQSLEYDPPRKPYTLIEIDKIDWLDELPDNFVPVTFC